MNLETLTQWLSEWAPWLLANSAGAGLLVLGVWLLRRYSALRNQPRWLYALGLLALLRLWMPGLPGIHWPWLQPAPVAAVAVVEETKPTPISLPVPMEEPKFSQAVIEFTTPPSPTPLPSLAVVEPVVVEQTISMTDILSFLWLTGALTVLGVASWQQARFSRRVARLAQPATEEQLELLAELQKLTGLRQRIALRIMPGLGAPAVFGWWRPRILLTETAAAELNLPELRHVLLHELSHIRRHDVLMNWVLILTRALHWFNPLVWLSQRWLVRDREILRDQQAMSFLATPEAPRDYGYTLLKLALPAGSPSTAPSLAPLFHSANELTRRILMISQTPGKRASKMQMLFASLAVSILTIATFTKAVAQETPATPKAPEVLGAIVSPQPTVGTPDESLEEPRAALKSFLDARNWQERAKFIQQAERLKPVMEAYYSTHPDGPIKVTSTDYLTTQPAPDGKGRFHLFSVECSPGPAFPVSIEAKENGWLVDWESFVEFKDLALPEYFKQSSDQPQTFHVMLHRAHYFAKDVPNQDQKLCFIVEPPIAGHVNYAWVNKDNQALLAKLGRRADFGAISYPIVKLRWVKEGDVSYVMLDDIIADSWRSDVPSTTATAPATVTRLDELHKKRNEVKQELAELEASSKAGKDLRQEILALQNVSRSIAAAYYDERYLKPAQKLSKEVAGLEKLRQEIEAELNILTEQGLGENHPDVTSLRDIKGKIVEMYYRAKYSVPEANPGGETSTQSAPDGLETRVAKLMQTSTSPALRATVAAWQEALKQRAELSARYLPKHPIAIRADEQLAKLRKELEELCRVGEAASKAPEKAASSTTSEKRRITILGEVMRPGAYNFPADQSLTILEAIGIAGGFSKTSESSKITIQRKNLAYPLHFNGKNGGPQWRRSPNRRWRRN